MTRRDMERQLWVLLVALASSTNKSNEITIIVYVLLLLVLLVSLVVNLIYWANPGGPAWGNHKWSRRRRLLLLKTFNYGASTSRILMIPGPRGLPVIGSMELMAGLAHHKIAAAAAAFQAKRLMAFSLGKTRVIVTCNPEVAKEILNSSEFGDRPVKESAYSLMFNRAIGFAPYGVYWRTLRRIAATHLFCPKQIKATESHRSQIASQMVQEIMMISRSCCGGGGGHQETSVVVMKDVLKQASLNNMMWSVFGRKYMQEERDDDAEVIIRKLVEEGYQLLGILNWSDHLPWLADFDLQKVRFRCSDLVSKVNLFVSRIIQQHMMMKPPPPPHHRHDQRPTPSQLLFHRDFVDVLLNLEGPDKLSNSDMIAVLWEMIFRGTDTVAVLVEWILARMVLHPEVQSKVQHELDGLTGEGSRALTESDITNGATTYMLAVVKEVLRLHPPGPLLSWARLAIRDTTVDGYDVPKGTTAMVNMWAIARDPEVWTDPLEFNPDRFLVVPKPPAEDQEYCGGGSSSTSASHDHEEFSVMGSDLRLAPFGSGRRACPGKSLALTTVTFWVATLLHEFEFQVATAVEGTGPDMSEVLRLSCEMAQPLRVRVRPRRSTTILRSQN